MTTIELHPEFLSNNGERQFAVLPYAEFLALREWMEDAEDLIALELAKKENLNEPSYTIEQVKAEFGIK